MALQAICPACHVANNASNVTCDVCGTALGAVLVAERGSDLVWLGLSALATAVAIGIAILLESAALLLVAPFYGPLVTSYFARSNVVWPAGLGGIAGSAALFLIVVLVKKDHAQAVVSLVVHSSGTLVILLIGLLVVLVSALPICLMGASVGELLSQRRRMPRQGKPAAESAEAIPPRRMTDEEIAKVEL